MEPSPQELAAISDEVDPLEDLFDEAQSKHTPKVSRRGVDPRQAAAHAEETLRRLYQDPANWHRTRAITLIDEDSGVLLGTYSEYLHNTVPTTRKLLREHQPMETSGVERIKGYLGADVEAQIRLQSWEEEHQVTATVQLDELMIEAPGVDLLVRTRFHGIIQARLAEKTLFALPSGNVLLELPKGTDIWRAASVDTKIRIRKAVERS